MVGGGGAYTTPVFLVHQSFKLQLWDDHGEITRKALPMYVVNIKMNDSPK